MRLTALTPYSAGSTDSDLYASTTDGGILITGFATGYQQIGGGPTDRPSHLGAALLDGTRVGFRPGGSADHVARELAALISALPGFEATLSDNCDFDSCTVETFTEAG